MLLKETMRASKSMSSTLTNGTILTRGSVASSLKTLQENSRSRVDKDALGRIDKR